MEQPVTPFPSDRAETRRWIGRIIIAVLLGQALWGLIVSVMNNLVVPWLGDFMGQSSGLPTSFTQRPYNYPDLFVSVLEVCIAGLVAAILNYFFQRPATIKAKTVKTSVPPAGPVRVFPETVRPAAMTATAVPPIPLAQSAQNQSTVAQAAPPTAPAAPIAIATPVNPSKTVNDVLRGPLAVEAPVREVQVVSPEAPAPLPAASPAAIPQPPSSKIAPANPKKPKKVYYNIVGEPMPSDDD